jgi:predicted Fe-Mo cluster-binding NifX family protein
VITRSIGPGAYEHLLSSGFEVFVVEETDPEKAIETFMRSRNSK